jgi:hypothetical protein
MQAIRIAAHPFSPGQHHGMATDLHTSSPGFHIVLSTLRFADNELVSRTIHNGNSATTLRSCCVMSSEAEPQTREHGGTAPPR